MGLHENGEERSNNDRIRGMTLKYKVVDETNKEDEDSEDEGGDDDFGDDFDFSDDEAVDEGLYFVLE